MSLTIRQQLAFDLFKHKDITIEQAYNLADEFMQFDCENQSVQDKTSDEVFSKLTSYLNFTNRTIANLNSHEIRTIRDLVLTSHSELMRKPNIGQKTLNEINDVLGDFGLKLGMTSDDITNYDPVVDKKMYRNIWLSKQITGINSALLVPHLGKEKRTAYEKKLQELKLELSK